MVPLYTAPDGYYDLPFIWIYDGSGLTNGVNALNQRVSIYAGYGDFILRRIVGMDRVLQANAGVNTGRFQVQDSRGRYIEEFPQYVGVGGAGSATQNSRDIAISKELYFRENTQINFDLYNVNKFNDPNGTTQVGAQVGFHGVRRIAGTSPLVPKYKYRPKEFVYVQKQTLPLFTLVMQAVQVVQPVDDYDFELHEIKLVYQSFAFAQNSAGSGVQFQFVAVALGTQGNGITVTVNNVAGPQSAPVVVTVVGTAITVNVLNGTPANQVAPAINAFQPAAALIVASQTAGPPGSAVIPTGLVTLAGGGANPSANAGNSALVLYDYNNVATSVSNSGTAPVIDAFINRLSYDTNGALVPPLWYPQQSLIRADFYNLTKNPLGLVIHYIGVRRVPC